WRNTADGSTAAPCIAACRAGASVRSSVGIRSTRATSSRRCAVVSDLQWPRSKEPSQRGNLDSRRKGGKRRHHRERIPAAMPASIVKKQSVGLLLLLLLVFSR